MCSKGLVNKERQLAGLQLEEKEQEAELWRKKYLRLQVSSLAVTAHTYISCPRRMLRGVCTY